MGPIFEYLENIFFFGYTLREKLLSSRLLYVVIYIIPT